MQNVLHDFLRPQHEPPIPLEQSRVRIGRKNHCDIVLPHRQVSGDHCELYKEGKYWYVKDLNSTHGTKVNGQPVSATPERMEPGDTLLVGNYRMQIEYHVEE